MFRPQGDLTLRTAVAVCVFAFLALLAAGNAAAQDFVWAKRMGGSSFDYGESVALDSAGNVYTTGKFAGTADFDPHPNVTYNLTSAGGYDIFVSKLDSNGNFVWAKRMGGGGTDAAYSITVGTAGNVSTTGYFNATADFDPGPGVYNLTSAGSIFVSKLDSNGNFVWAKKMGGTGIASGTGISLTVDTAGCVYTTGYFHLTADFDPDPAVTYDLTTPGDYDIFVSKLDSNGNFVWAKRMGGIQGDHGFSVAVDSAGSVYTTGQFEGTADFDPDPNVTYSLTTPGDSDIFVSKLDSNGNFVWAKAMRGTGNNYDYGDALAVDSAGSVYTTGQFEGTVDFDPHPDVTYDLTTAGSVDIFLSKLDSNGNFVWAKRMGGAGDEYGDALAVDSAGSVYTTGYFHGTVDFDPHPDVTYDLTTAGSGDIFLSKLDSNGNFVWAKRMGGAGDEYGASIALDGAGSVYTMGQFEGTADFDPGSGTYDQTSAGLYDTFVSKLGLLTGAGAVPDRRFVPGTPLSMRKAGGTLLTLAWGPSCRSGDVDYEVYEGILGSFTSHVPVHCSTGGATSATISPSSESHYYLVVPTAGVEGSYGRNSFGLERPASDFACVSQAIANCP